MSLCPHMAKRMVGWEHPPPNASCWSCLPVPKHFETPEHKRERLRLQSEREGTRRRHTDDYTEATHLSPYNF